MSEKSKSTAFLLCYFLGLLGVHRFYLNRVKTGLLMLVTLGGLGIWWLVDSVLIAAGQLRDGAGDPLRTGPPDPDNPAAGFWVRLAAISVDGVILQLILTVVFMGLGIVLPLLGVSAVALGAMEGNLEAMGDEQQAMMALMLSAGIGLLSMALAILYFAVQHASRHQATVGKRCFDIRLITGDGARVGLLRAIWRTIGYVFSAIPLCLGFVMAGFTRDKRALHDYLAGTRVRYVHETASQEVSPEATRIPEPPVAPAVPVAPASMATVDKSATPGTALMVLGALLIAGAAALALML